MNYAGVSSKAKNNIHKQKKKVSLFTIKKAPEWEP